MNSTKEQTINNTLQGDFCLAGYVIYLYKSMLIRRFPKE